MRNRFYYSLLLLVVMLCTKLNAQDRIIKNNGDSIICKVIEIGTNAVSYKKPGAAETLVENKSDIKYIRYENGTVEDFGKSTAVSGGTATAGTQTTGAQSGKNKIEISGDKFFFNGEPRTRKQINKELSKAKNPAIPLMLKSAKAMKTAQTIVKITSFPTTIGGSFATLVTGVNMFNDIRRGRDNTKTYVGAFSSLLTTISLPITNKILKKNSDKMYKKIIDMYNLTN